MSFYNPVWIIDVTTEEELKEEEFQYHIDDDLRQMVLKALDAKKKSQQKVVAEQDERNMCKSADMDEDNSDDYIILSSSSEVELAATTTNLSNVKSIEATSHSTEKTDDSIKNSSAHLTESQKNAKPKNNHQLKNSTIEGGNKPQPRTDEEKLEMIRKKVKETSTVRVAQILKPISQLGNSSVPSNSQNRHTSPRNIVKATCDPKQDTNKKVANDDSISSKLLDHFHKRLIDVPELKVKDDELKALTEQIEKEFKTQLDHQTMLRKLKDIRLNLINKNNKTFFRKIVEGQIKPEELPKMSSDDMKDDELKERERIEREKEIEKLEKYTKECREAELRQAQRRISRLESMGVKPIGIDKTPRPAAQSSKSISLNFESILSDDLDLVQQRVIDQLKNTNSNSITRESSNPSTVNIIPKSNSIQASAKSIVSNQPANSNVNILTKNATSTEITQTGHFNDGSFVRMVVSTNAQHKSANLMKTVVNKPIEIIWRGCFRLENEFTTSFKALEIVEFANGQVYPNNKRLILIKQKLVGYANTLILDTEKRIVSNNIWHHILSNSPDIAVVELLHDSEHEYKYLSHFNNKYGQKLISFDPFEQVVNRIFQLSQENIFLHILRPRSLKNFIETIYVVPLAKSVQESAEFNLYEKYRIPIKRDCNKLLGIVVFRPTPTLTPNPKPIPIQKPIPIPISLPLPTPIYQPVNQPFKRKFDQQNGTIHKPQQKSKKRKSTPFINQQNQPQQRTAHQAEPLMNLAINKPRQINQSSQLLNPEDNWITSVLNSRRINWF